MAERIVQEESLTTVADAIRAKGGTTDPLSFPDGFKTAIEAIQAGGGGAAAAVPMKDVNFYDYDGTRLYSYTVAEAQALTELPALPSQPGLICQGWNWTLEDIKAHNRAVDVGAEYDTDDGTARIYITLKEGRTSPMIGVCPNGTITVDWGDGTAPDVLTGSSTTSLVYTPTHEYASPGDYVIRLTVDGEIGIKSSSNYSVILAHSSVNDKINECYRAAVNKIELCTKVTKFSARAFCGLTQLSAILLPTGAKPFDLLSSPEYAFYNCASLAYVGFPKGTKKIASNAFNNCFSLKTVAFPTSLGSIYNSAFEYCRTLRVVVVPYSVTYFGSSAFSNCDSLATVLLPNGLTSIPSSMFYGCKALTSIAIPKSVTTINNGAFSSSYNTLHFVDFSQHAAVPTLSSTNAFSGIPSDCQIRVPAALADEWKAATNWSTYASQIVAV